MAEPGVSMGNSSRLNSLDGDRGCPRNGSKSETDQIPTEVTREHFVCLVARDRSEVSDVLVDEASDVALPNIIRSKNRRVNSPQGL
jgi:hypothetical protein